MPFGNSSEFDSITGNMPAGYVFPAAVGVSNKLEWRLRRERSARAKNDPAPQTRPARWTLRSKGIPALGPNQMRRSRLTDTQENPERHWAQPIIGLRYLQGLR
jgi:hypothetical protein